MITIIACILIGASMTVSGQQQRNCTAPHLGKDLTISRGRKTTYKTGNYVLLSCKYPRTHFIAGTRWRICKNGTWTGQMPHCFKKRRTKIVKCSSVTIRNGYKQGSRRNVNSVIRFRCARRYFLVGKAKLICLGTGKWNAKTPRCLRDVNCPRLKDPRNGRYFGSSNKNGRTVKFFCNKGFKLEGSQSRRCMSNKRWSGKEAKCKKINPLNELREVADNLRKNLVNKFGLVTSDSRARSGISSGASGLDFVFVLDTSASVGPANFQRGIKFVKTIIEEYGVSIKPQGTRVAIVTFQSTPKVWHNLQTDVIQNINQSMQALGNLKFEGGGTDIAKALDKVYHVVLPQTRKKTKKVLFLITDGHSNAGSDPSTTAGRLREKMFEIFTIGITKDADERELKSIATQPYRSHIYLLANYATLEKLKDMITGEGIDSWPCGSAGNTGLMDEIKTPNTKPSMDDAWPWQAAIYIDGNFQCGGSLIARNWVLTSQRCFQSNMIKDASSNNIEVSLGLYDRLESYGTEQYVKVIKIFRLKKFAKKSRDDLALLKLETNKTAPTAFVHQVCLDENPDSTLIWPTQYGVISGWGSNKTRGRQPMPMNEILHQAVVNFVSLRECKEKTKYNLRGQVHCCTSRDNTVKKCLGDTGGPVMARTLDDTWMLVGVIKYNEGCFDMAAKYTAFTKVGYYSKWITETMKNNP